MLGPIERELYARLAEDLLPGGTRRADELGWRIGGCGAEVSVRLAKLGLSAAIVTGVASTEDDKRVLSWLRQRGVHTRGGRSHTQRMPISVRIRAPERELRVISPQSDAAPPKQAVLRALPGSRHLHVCGRILIDRQSVATVRSGLARAGDSGASTSLDVSSLPPGKTDWAALGNILRHVDLVFARSETLRPLAERNRVGDAAASVLELGVRAVAVRLGAGGFRVYEPDETVRVPRFGDEVEAETDAFASGFLLGWLLGASAEVCAVIGGAATPATVKSKLPPDRRELVSRLARARTSPRFRKLVPVLGESQRLLERARRLPRRDFTAAKNPVSR